MQRRDIALAALAAAIARVGGAALVYSLGFRAVSDDDFARVVIAQRFAALPRLDPTGTSWLPLPFWTMGGAMRVLGSSLAMARGISIFAAALCGALVAGVAVAAGMKRHRAIAAGIVAATMPWAMQLAVATVPEVPAATCAAAGAIALAAASSRVRVVGALAILASTLSRYDAWPLAAAFTVVTLLDARRARGRDRALLVVAAAIAAFGPAAWSTWQLARYGDAFRYLRLVRSYRQALGQGPSLLLRFVGYPYGVVEEMREALAAGILGAICALVVERRGHSLGLDWRRPLSLALLQLLVLIAGDVRDGAPTHHAERALLGPATIVLFATGDAIFAFLEGTRSTAKRLVAASVMAVLLYGYIGLRLHRSLRWYAAAPRPRELAAGRALSTLPAGTRLLVDTRDLPGSIDYGYYAVLAAFGRPSLAEVDRDQDPRKPRGRSAFEDEGRLRARARDARATAALVWGEDRRRVVESIGGRVVAEEPRGAGEPRWTVMTLGEP